MNDVFSELSLVQRDLNAMRTAPFLFSAEQIEKMTNREQTLQREVDAIPPAERQYVGRWELLMYLPLYLIANMSLNDQNALCSLIETFKDAVSFPVLREAVYRKASEFISAREVKEAAAKKEKEKES